MPSTVSRRKLLAGAVGALGAVATGGYAWNQHARRYHLRFRPLEARNESDDPVTVSFAVGSDLEDGYETAVDLESADGDGDGTDADGQHVAGPWIKRARPYAIRAAIDGDELVLENHELVDRLEGSGWGSDCAHVTVVVTAERRLEAGVGPSDVC